MIVEITHCEGCGEALENRPSIDGRLRKCRKWCSERCRRRSYDSQCIDCGTRVAYASYRCADCAHDAQTVWTREAIVLAIQRFAEENGRPPTAIDWNPALARSKNMSFASGVGERWPYVNRVQYAFGSWNAGIEAAGFTPLRQGGGRRTDRS